MTHQGPLSSAEERAVVWGDKHWFCRLEFKREDCWVGVFWRRDRIAYKHTFDVWVCLLPMLPIHFGWCRYDLTPDDWDDAPSMIERMRQRLETHGFDGEGGPECLR